GGGTRGGSEARLHLAHGGIRQANPGRNQRANVSRGRTGRRWRAHGRSGRGVRGPPSGRRERGAVRTRRLVATYFLDENLDGKTFRSVLTWAGVPFLGASDRGLRGQPDALWIPMVSAEGLEIVTSDVRTRFQPDRKSTRLNS